MRIIREEQLHLLGAPKREAFEAWLVEQLAARYPLHSSRLGSQGLAAFVARGVDAAAKYGIHTGDAVTGFVGLLLEFGENFEHLPDDTGVLAILRDDELPGQLKIILLHECVTAATGGRRLLPVE